MSLESYLSFFDEDFSGVGFFFADSLALEIGVRLGETETECDDQDGNTSSEPEEGTPAVANRIDERASKNGCEEVAEGVSLLKHSGDDTSSLRRTVFESYFHALLAEN